MGLILSDAVIQNASFDENFLKGVLNSIISPWTPYYLKLRTIVKANLYTPQYLVCG